ncbi:unnamed protein product [Oikopleura dioica]|uniref:Kazal-like domain-containing protein n=1 Tax=Oikopleura dioica TaxID=34765 RepID=E4Y4C6_OIKDI|nr:unnamed protein product [Oikopleura dioica]
MKKKFVDFKLSCPDEQKAIAAAYAGIARERTECLRGCTLNLLPVCGTDGNSYPNSCVLTERKCSSSPDLQILHHGFCHRTVHNDDYDEYMQQKDPNWNNDLPDYDSPLFRVNDNNVLTVNVDYENEFENDQLFLFDAALESSEYDEEEEIETTTDLQTTQASTIAAATQNPKCVDAYPKFIDGKFEKCPSSKENYKPVCGSDEITYFNECHFTSTICFTPEKSEIEIVHDGVCKSDPFHAFHEALESKRKTQTGTGLDRSGGDARRIKMEKATARREKRLQHRQNRKNGIKKQIIVSARSNIVNQDENTDEVKSEKQLSRYEKRVAWRRQRKNNKKPTSSTPMLFDVGVPAEPLNELDEKFPDLCSEIDCEDFAEPSAAICGRVKNMSEKELTGKIWSFRSRCFFKRKRCHLIKKSQQIFAAEIRKQKNSLEKSGKEEDAIKIKFNKSGSRLKRVNCDTGELFQKNETPEKPEEDFSESEFENY